MKPVFQEDNFKRLQALIDGDNPAYKESDINDLVAKFESSLKEYKDNKENKILLYLGSSLVVIFSLISLYLSMSIWPLLFLVLWLGLFMYYRVHERGLINDTLRIKANISPKDSIPKIEYLQSAIDLKNGRKSLLKFLLSIFFPAAAMMAFRLFKSESSSILIFLMFVIPFALSLFFWNDYFGKETKVLEKMKDQLQELKTKVILDRSDHASEEE